jgi:integrase/recombinase XerD
MHRRFVLRRHASRRLRVEADARYQAKNAEFNLSPSELQSLIDHAASLRDRLIIALFVYTGLRRAELQKLRAADVDYPRRRLLIRSGKGGKQRIVFLTDSLIEDLGKHAESNGRFLFSGRGERPMSLRNINYIVSRTAERAGVQTPNPRYSSVGPHLLRHSFARNWKRAGGSLESLQKLLGHSSLKTTLDIYGTESQGETEDNFRLIAKMLAFKS